MVKNGVVKLGKCPYCGSDNYERHVNDWQDDYCMLDCICQDCEKEFTEYFELDEVKFDKEGEEFIYNKTLGRYEKDMLLSAFGNPLINNDESMETINAIRNKLNDVCVREE